MLGFIIILFASTFSRSQASTNVGGMLLQNTIWSSSGGANPYYLINNVYVPRNVTLTIQAGVKILFDRGDFEILVKGFLHVQGTVSHPVLFYNGTATNTKWMVTLQSTDLSASSINYAIFTGPQKGLQITTALAGLPQNTGVLVVQNTAFLENTSIESNGNYPFNCYFPLRRSSPAPSLQLISAVIKNSLVSTGNTFSESILITSSKLFNTTIRPAAALDGIQFVDAKMKNVTIKVDFINQNYPSAPALLQFNDSIIENAVEQYSDGWRLPSVHIRVFRSTIRDSVFMMSFSDSYSYYYYYYYYNYWGNLNSFIIQDSTINNVSIDIGGSENYYYYYYYYYYGYGSYYYGSSFNYYSSIVVNNSVFHNGAITLFGYGPSATFQDSNFTDVNITYMKPYQYYNKGVKIRNVNFRNGIMNLPLPNVLISYSTIELKAPPLVLGDYSTIVCSSVKRSSTIAQENTIGIQAPSVNIALSSIRSFAVGVEMTSNSTQKSSILSSNFISNSVFNIRNVGPYNIEATDNWWGSVNSADIQNKIYDYWDNINSGEVIYSRASNVKLQAEDGCPPYNVYTILANFSSSA